MVSAETLGGRSSENPNLAMKRGEQCGVCGKEERWFFLHNLKHRGSYRRMCSNCLLKNHPGLFCPFCFHVYNDSLPPSPALRLMCLNCPSIAHSNCAPPPSPPNSSSFICPPCSSPSFSFFRPDPSSPLPPGAALALVAAAKIAASSMAKAAAAARLEAEKRVKDAALAKKRAREALERLAYLASIDREKDRAYPIFTSSSPLHHSDSRAPSQANSNGPPRPGNNPR